MSKVLVIGATNIDIIGISNQALIKGDSNLGQIEMTIGGVGKNIAENLYRLGVDVQFLTFIGGGFFGKSMKQYFNALGINYEQSYENETLECGKYLAIHDTDGSLDKGINDYRLVESVEVAFFEKMKDYIDTFDTLVLDTNLSEEVLTYLITTYQSKKIYVDGVSQTKVKRISKLLKMIDLLKVNVKELSALLDKNIDDVILGVRSLVEQGVTTVIVTNGSEPITYNIEKRIYQTLIFEPVSIKSSVGAGDALFSGIIYGLDKQDSMHEALNLGKKASSMTMESFGPVNINLTNKSIEE